MGLIGRSKRIARPLLLASNWDIQTPTQPHFQEKDGRRARMIERLEKTSHLNWQTFTRLDGDFQQVYLEHIPSEEYASARYSRQVVR